MDKKEQAEVYNIYLRKAAEIYGVTRTRQIYEKAIEILSEAESRPMCLRFAEMETKLGEVDIIIIIIIIIKNEIIIFIIIRWTGSALSSPTPARCVTPGKE